jgi:hypothetical protein
MIPLGYRHEGHVKEHPKNRQEIAAEDGRAGQTLPLRQVPQTQPEAREDARSLVLSGVQKPCKRRVMSGRE